ncbi:hypothetical protein C8R43DRAFT_987433 [Mycena crocata]|nr:hypothetical protein C8R43DRAFT_987433 [Mycena crocata]
MDNPDILELQDAAREVVADAKRQGKLHSFTPRIILQELEERFKLPEGFLRAKRYKDPLKKVIASEVATEQETEDTPSNDAQIPAGETRKRKAEETLDSKPKKKPNTKPRKPRKKSNPEFKSAETIESSDVSDAEPHEDASFEKPLVAPQSTRSAKENQAISSGKLGKKSAGSANSSTTKSAARPSTSSAAAVPVESDSEISDLDDGPSKRAKKPKTTEPKDKRDSELSVLDDEPPKRAKKPKAAKSKDKGDEKPKTSKGKKVETKDEATIKHLKSLVLACGVRRQWAKVFEDADLPSQQIKILKKILTDLGMSGRMSLAQAKTIKEKRELAQELEDVQAFAAAATRPKPVKPSHEEEAEKSSEEEEEEEELPIKRKTNARRSIMEFLGDQSDDD